MPGSVANAVVPTVAGNPLVFPRALCRAFTLAINWQVRSNEYHDGTTQRQALVANDRRTWKLTQRLTPAQDATLRTFALTYPTDACYFYDPKDVAVGQIEGANYDATGASLQGRWKVVLSMSEYAETTYIPRAEVSIELREVA